jgi:hypothetical protein
LPLYRQSVILAREGIDVDLADWMGHLDWWAMPLYRLIGDHVIAAAVLHTDDTPIRRLAPGWGARSPRGSRSMPSIPEPTMDAGLRRHSTAAVRVSVNPGHRFQQFADRDFSNYGTGIPLNRGQSRRLVFGGAVQAMFFLKLEFERGNAETEASETDHCERPTIDPEADV